MYRKIVNYYFVHLILLVTCDIVATNDLGQINFQELKTWDGPRRPLQTPLDAVWQPVADTKYPLYVYSAFVDRRRKTPAVVVIGVTRKTRIKPPLFCRFWKLGSNTTYILQAEIKYTKEYDLLYNNTAFVLCLLKKLLPEDTVEGSISIVSQTAPKRLATNLIKVLDTTPEKSIMDNIHICVSPYKSTADVEWLVEWIELNKMLGATHFYFYNTSVDARVDCVIRNYPDREQLFTVLPFHSPIKNVWNEGQLASSQDCLYRSMPRAAWLMPLDLNEVVLPHRAGLQMMLQKKRLNSTIYMMLFNSMLHRYYSLTDKQFALLFRNAFFYQGFEDDPDSPRPLLTSRKTKRLELLNWYGVRSKYAVQPSQATELGLYKVREFVSDEDSLDVRVGSDIAILHNYRRECIQYKCTEGYPTTVDRVAHVWAKPLWKRVQDRMAEIKDVCFHKPVVGDKNNYNVNESQ